MGYNLLINEVYWVYNPLTNFLGHPSNPNTHLWEKPQYQLPGQGKEVVLPSRQLFCRGTCMGVPWQAEPEPEFVAESCWEEETELPEVLTTFSVQDFFLLTSLRLAWFYCFLWMCCHQLICWVCLLIADFPSTYSLPCGISGNIE